MTVCMNEGREAAEELAKGYIDGIKTHAGMEYSINDVKNKKGKIR